MRGERIGERAKHLLDLGSQIHHFLRFFFTNEPERSREEDLAFQLTCQSSRDADEPAILGIAVATGSLGQIR